MPVKSVFLPLTRLWLNGGRGVVALALTVALAWAYAQTFLREFPSTVEIRQPHEMELRHLAMTTETRKDLALDFSRGVSEPLNNWLPHRTDGVVRPLWPWLAAWLVDASQGQSAVLSPRFARQVHLLKLSFSLSVLVLLGLACARAFSVPAAALTVFLVGFGVWLPSSRFFLPDLLFSVLFLLTWITCIAALKRNSLWLHGAIGFLAALANLTAPTATPLMLVFVGVSTLRWMWGWIVGHFAPGGGTTLWVRRNHWLGLLLLGVCHVITVGPMMSFAQQKLGDATPFHWRWFENSDEMRAWTRTHQTPDVLRAVPEEKVPSIENYRATHTTEEIRGRLKSGAFALVKEVLGFDWSRGCSRGSFAAAFGGLLVLLVLVLLFMAPRAHHAGQALHPETAPIVLFTVLALVVCTFDFGWDMPVLDSGSRPLAIYGPFILSLVWACEALIHRVRRRQMRLPVLFLYELTLWLLCAAAAWWLIAFLQPTSSTA
ncbi:MAG: hypothetical protein IAE77_29950 [Prosthecobacter sp.]|jgi:hypothetical protein|uniref:hypothetical protein n=1 Tax=Prosthecobacter sp. TaxID=1965333 RepID=UPI0019DE3327|nr:hypothetical protein [Prosthecobacter sp.]MBE2287719.1 hypothetical protein [Prosthecobacter sp.]